MKRVCLLTGAGGRFGSVFCRMARKQFRIAAVCRSRRPDVPSQHQWYRDPLEPERSPAESDDPVFVIDADLTKAGEIERVVDIALARFERIDLLVNAATDFRATTATIPERIATALETEFNYNAVIPAKLSATILQAFWRDRDIENRAERRNVINLSSTSSYYVYPNVGQAAYAPSKAAVNHLTRYMSLEYRPYGVRVNALAPTSFPSVVTTESVVEAALRLDREDHDARVLVLDETGETLY
jgi:NAD(P)-dependent dehydrogenase (short-subunit alcohol dehydrogenase family)